MGRPVITFAPNSFGSLPSIVLCTDLNELPKIIQKKLRGESASNAIATKHALTELFDFVVSGEFNRNFGENPTKLLDSDVATFCDLILSQIKHTDTAHTT